MPAARSSGTVIGSSKDRSLTDGNRSATARHQVEHHQLDVRVGEPVAEGHQRDPEGGPRQHLAGGREGHGDAEEGADRADGVAHRHQAGAGEEPPEATAEMAARSQPPANAPMRRKKACSSVRSGASRSSTPASAVAVPVASVREGVSAGSLAPMLLVMITTVLVKSARRPRPSVKRP